MSYNNIIITTEKSADFRHKLMIIGLVMTIIITKECWCNYIGHIQYHLCTYPISNSQYNYSPILRNNWNGTSCYKTEMHFRDDVCRLDWIAVLLKWMYKSYIINTIIIISLL